MADLNIHLDVNISPGALRCGMVALLLSVFAGDLGSESVTLTTYYPAPSGVYTQMITTGNTYLARDGASKVGVGTTNPATALSVVGDMTSQPVSGGWGNRIMSRFHANDDQYSATLAWGSLQLGAPGPNYIIAGKTGAGGSLTFLTNSTNDYKWGPGGTPMNGTQAMTLTQNGAIEAYQSCNQVDFNAVGFTPCPSGQYATYSEGFWARNTIFSGPGALSGSMYCCQR